MAHLLFISTTVNKAITAFSWMLIHSLWQGLLLAVIGGAVLMLTKRSNAAYRYNAVLVLFMAFITICACTFMAEWNSTISKTIAPSIAGGISVNVSSLFSGNADDIKQLVKTFTGYFSANAPMVVLIWFIFFLFKSVKMIACLVYNYRIRHLQIYEPDKFWADAVARFSEKLQIKKAVRLLQSGYIKVPVVVGHLKPVILIPMGLLTGLPAGQVEAILLHELAHIRRNDYLTNFLQNIVETIFFFNPGLLWISSLLREERENCCDDIALEQTQNKKGFIQALISFKEHELYGSGYATAFPGKKNYLMRRVSRIMTNENKNFGFGEKIFFTVGLVILSLIVTTITVAQLKGASKTIFGHTNYGIAHNTQQKAVVVNKKRHAKPIKAVAKFTTAKLKTMNYSIPGIRREGRQTEFAEDSKIENVSISQLVEKVEIDSNPENVSANQPIESASAHAKKQQTLTEQARAEQDQIQAEKDQAQARLDQEQARRDQAQALKDQIQAKIDQQQALKDQAQAKSNQRQTMKEKAMADMGKTKVNNR
jgi:bla regulator protein blaR1